MGFSCHTRVPTNLAYTYSCSLSILRMLVLVADPKDARARCRSQGYSSSIPIHLMSVLSLLLRESVNDSLSEVAGHSPDLMCSRLRGSVLKTLHPTKLLAVCPVVCGCFRVRDDGEDVPGGAGLLYGSSTIALRHVRMPTAASDARPIRWPLGCGWWQ